MRGNRSNWGGRPTADMIMMIMLYEQLFIQVYLYINEQGSSFFLDTNILFVCNRSS